MRKYLPLYFLFSFLFSITLLAQDSTGAVDRWVVSSKKTGEKEYQLSFAARAKTGWQIYAPNQVLAEITSVLLRFSDTSLQLDSGFIIDPAPETVQSSIFESRVNVHTNQISWTKKVRFPGQVPARLIGSLEYFYGNKEGFYPHILPFNVEMEGGVSDSIRLRIPTLDIDNPLVNCGDTINKDSSLLVIFLLGLLGGFIALLTPCVFPMIPLTVSFFTKQATNKRKGIFNALQYGFFIFLIYVLLTIPFHVAGKTSPEIFNNLSTSVALNLVFFAIFVAFALSFFGLFEIALPASVANRMNSKAGIGNTFGIFFMAVTLAIVSFSCTGPVFGTFLVSVADQGPWPLTVAAAGFGLALGLPFALFALFPRWLNAIPKSGGWMTDVKVVLGFIELALAIKFLANADNVKQWGFLKREIFVALWAAIGLAIVLYLSGILRKRANRIKRFTITRIFFLLIFTGITAYLVPGLFNIKAARLPLISGFPPPTCYSIYEHPVNCDEPLLDYELALREAKRTNKPVLVDFTGWACVNCRRMEEKVWTNARVEKLMKEEFILVSLYVDERRKLPTTQQTVYTNKEGVEKSIITVGDRWTTFQIENFKATSQPQYVMVTPDEKVLAHSKFYTPSASEFADWLDCGLRAHKDQNK